MAGSADHNHFDLHAGAGQRAERAVAARLAATADAAPFAETDGNPKADVEAFLNGLRHAWKAGETRPTSRKKPPVPRGRRRPDPLAEITDNLKAWFDEEPSQTARELLCKLQVAHPDTYSDALLRTVQRRLKIWRGDIARSLVFGASGDASPLLTLCAMWRLRASEVSRHRPGLVHAAVSFCGNNRMRQRYDSSGTSSNAAIRVSPCLSRCRSQPALMTSPASPHSFCACPATVRAAACCMVRIAACPMGPANGELAASMRDEPKCLIPSFDRASLSFETKDALWAKFTMGAPRRQRRSVEPYNIVMSGRGPLINGLFSAMGRSRVRSCLRPVVAVL